MRFFIDTNVLVYTREAKDQAKQNRARLWLREIGNRNLGVLNLQFLNELCYVISRKSPEFTIDEIRAWVLQLRKWGDTSIDFETMEMAWRLRAVYRYAWFDCLHLAAAHQLNCSHFLSEDMSDRQNIDGMVLINPFSTHPDALLNAS